MADDEVRFDKALVLLFDNCQHVIVESAAAIERILSACPRVRILATSREPLRLRENTRNACLR
jgi:predicted ATPase